MATEVPSPKVTVVTPPMVFTSTSVEATRKLRRVISGSAHDRYWQNRHLARSGRWPISTTGTATDCIRASATIQDVVARSTHQSVVSGVARQDVIACAALKFIISVTARQGVGALAATVPIVTSFAE